MSKEPDLYTQNRELAWLNFNARILEEARDPSLPLFERLKFISIFTNNLDEFFMVRVGKLTRLAHHSPLHRDINSGLAPTQQLNMISQAMPDFYLQRDVVFHELEAQLRTHQVHRLSPGELTCAEHTQSRHFFDTQVTPLLSPIVLDPYHPFPHLSSKVPTIVLSLRQNDQEYLALIPIPKTLPSFLILDGPSLRYILMEQLIQLFSDTLFPGYTRLSQGVISITRSAALNFRNTECNENDFSLHMEKSLKKRPYLPAVRLEVQGVLPLSALQTLKEHLHITDQWIYSFTAPISLNYVYDLTQHLSAQSAPALCRKSPSPAWPSSLSKHHKIIPQLLQRDVLLYFPYHSMAPFLALLQEAIYDFNVLSIKITIYRLAPHSQLIELLIAAAKNGKDVLILTELQARFDEENNIRWAKRLKKAGCTVIYGIAGYKVHAKICLIVRRECGKVQYITQIGTGNYNEKTVKTYSDFSLITADPLIGADVVKFFQCLTAGNMAGDFQLLLVSPNKLRPALLQLIDEEISKGSDGSIFLKMNSLTDRTLIDKLIQASQAGVHIVINARGACCLRPGIPGFTDHVRVFSIVGRFLEHARLFVFGKGSSAKMYLSSADFMVRNMQRRVEVACPVLDPHIRQQLAHYIEILCQDNVKARNITADGSFSPLPHHNGTAFDAQEHLLQELSSAPKLPAPLVISDVPALKQITDSPATPI